MTLLYRMESGNHWGGREMDKIEHVMNWHFVAKSQHLNGENGETVCRAGV